MRASVKDIAIPMAVVAVIGMMIVPLPGAVLDFLLALNITFALLFLISSVYLTHSKNFTSLPTILLLTTLFRLGLNISTTREILSGGSAPEMIVAFGNFVVGGNLIVGVVIFIIITLIQFLVIAKGAERVAEVAARFTLDAMPGKQMSIDADLRAGAIGLSEARELRRGLQTESKLFGALDGAMKFVKGDAIAGLLISLVNIAAGVLVGMSQQGLSAQESLSKYALFTVGDGLVSQIPALLVAVAAGIAVTRVDDGKGQFVGRVLIEQLSREPQALGTCSFVLLILALMPGLPLTPFLLAAGLLGFAAFNLSKGKARKEAGQLSIFRPKVSSSIVLHVTEASLELLHQDRSLPEKIEKLRERIFAEWGMLIPEVQFDIRELSGNNAVVLHHKHVPFKVISRVEGTTGVRLNSLILSGLEELCESHRAELIDDTQTRLMLELAATEAEDLVNSVVPEILSVTSLTKILRALLVEGVGIRNVRGILQAIAESSVRLELSGGVLSDDSIQVLLSRVRMALSREICHSLSDSNWKLDVWRLSEAVDRTIAHAVMNQEFIETGKLREIISSICSQLNEHRVIVCSSYSRSYLFHLLKNEINGLRVLSAEELVPEVQLRVIGEIGVVTPKLKVA